MKGLILHSSTVTRFKFTGFGWIRKAKCPSWRDPETRRELVFIRIAGFPGRTDEDRSEELDFCGGGEPSQSENGNVAESSKAGLAQAMSSPR